jgi:hypothetical protein
MCTLFVALFALHLSTYKRVPIAKRPILKIAHLGSREVERGAAVLVAHVDVGHAGLEDPGDNLMKQFLP